MKDQSKKVANLKHKEQVEKSRNAQLVEEARKREDNISENSQQIKVRSEGVEEVEEEEGGGEGGGGGGGGGEGGEGGGEGEGEHEVVEEWGEERALDGGEQERRDVHNRCCIATPLHS